MQQRLEEWIKQPEIKRRICGALSPEEKARRIGKIFRREPVEPKSGLSTEMLALIEKQAKLM